VVVDKKAADSTHYKIMIDGKIVLNFSGDSTTAVKLNPGEHYVQVNDSAKRNFTVTADGGILNLDNQEYVVYEIKYTGQTNDGFNGNLKDRLADINMEMGQFRMRAAILVDSFIIFPKTKRPPPDSVLRALIPKLTGDSSNDNNNNRAYAYGSLRKTGKGQLFVPKTWDYSMTDSIPETLTVTTSKYSIGSSTQTRTTILRARNFLFAVLLSGQEDYSVKSLSEIRKGSEDKKKTKEKESKQMEF
jgi:hypothetical protein